VLDSASLRRAPTGSAVLELELGRGDRQDAFGRIAGIEVDQQGNTYVLDALARNIRVFDTSGDHVRTIGRRGSGPGGFTRPHAGSRLGPSNGLTLAHDTLFVLDDRLQAFDTSGVYLTAADPEIEFFNVIGITATPAGVVLERMSSVPNTQAAFTFELFDLTRDRPTVMFHVNENYKDYDDGRSAPPVPLPTLPFATSPSGGVYFAVGDSLHVDRFSADGEIDESFVGSVPRVRITTQDVDDFVASWIARNIRPGELRNPEMRNFSARFSRKIERRDRAPYVEAISTLIASDRESLLLKRSDLTPRPYLTQNRTAVWSLLDAQGQPLGTFVLPSEFDPKIFVGCSLSGVSVVEDGVQIVSRYRLATPKSPEC
jgi:hypothetical protein